MQYTVVSNADLIEETRQVAREMMDDDRLCAGWLMELAAVLPLKSTVTTWERGDVALMTGEAAPVTVEMVRPNGILVRTRWGNDVLAQESQLTAVSE